jgi:glyoxylase I family protein
LVKGLHHLALVTNDVGRAEAFYGALLGLPFLRRQEDERGLRSVWLSLAPAADASQFLALERAEAVGPTRRDEAPGLHCLALGITLEERLPLQEKLHEAGHPTVRETAYTFYVRDPDGVLVGLSHYPVSYTAGSTAAP